MKIQKHSAIMRSMNSLHMRLGYVGYAMVGEKWNTHLLATPFNRLYLIESGTGILSTEKEELRLEPGKAYLLPAGLPCSYHCDGALSLLFFHFNLTAASQVDLLRNIEHLPSTDFSGAAFQHICRICKQGGCANAFEVNYFLNGLLLQLHKKHRFSWDDMPIHSDCVAGAITRINEKLSAQLRIDELAQACYVSRSYLARKFKQETGMTIKEYILMQLINSAQWQLSHTDTTVERISRELGFCNQFYFSECFKKHCRVSPLQYRNGTKY